MAAAFLLSAGCQSILGLDKYQPGPADPAGSGGAGSGGKGSGGQGGQGGDPGTDCERVADCNDNNDCTSDKCKSGQCIHETMAAGSACEGGVCSGVAGAEKCQVCIDNEPDSEIDSGCNEQAPQCSTTGTVRCLGCEKHLDCDDDNECTLDACRSNGRCEYTARAAGHKCKQGVCNGQAIEDACVTCVDSEDDLGVDSGCDEDAPICSGSACLKCQDSGDEVDLGCTEGAPSCDETSGLCFNECSSVECDNGGCKLVGDDSACPTMDGCQGRCDLEQGCVVRVRKTRNDLLSDKSFEDAYTPWAVAESIAGENYEEVEDLETVFKIVNDAQDLDWVARLQGAADHSYLFYQAFEMPERTVSLKFSGYYRSSVSTVGGEPLGIIFKGQLYNYETDKFGPDVLTTKPGQPFSIEPLTDGWTYFEYELTDFSLFPIERNPEINFIGETGTADPLVYYEVDNVDLVATFCE